METVTLTQVLAARDHRVQRQQALLNQYGKPLISFTMNIAGPVKTSALIEQGFRLSLRRLSQQLLRQRYPVLHWEETCGITGCEALFVVDAPAEQLKALTTDLEEADQLGRLLDLDVLDVQGNKLNRLQERGCLICGAVGRGCARSRAHSVQQLQETTTHILTEAIHKHERHMAAELACRALLFEACTTPKPGLVDRRNNGSHSDMDLFSFMSSAAALTPYLETCVAIGQETANLLPEETFRRLRRPGRLAEGEMLRATGGVNTHKGALFLLGILCGAVGRLGIAKWGVSDAIVSECAAMTKGLTAAECSAGRNTTAGEQFFSAHGIRGIRGEVEAGLPTVREHGYPALQDALAAGRSADEAGCLALIAMMSVAEDTALLHRSGIEGWQQAKTLSAQLLASGVTKETMEQLDEDFIAHNWSPGGCADLLAVCWFLRFLKEEII